MTHYELCSDLAHNLGTSFIEVPLGSVWLSRPQIADVINVRPSYTRFNIDIYECKVSRADFLSDLRSKKYEGYLPHCHRFFFAVESGVATVKDIPETVGLIIRGENGWKVVKAAKKRIIQPDHEMLLSMIFYRKKDKHVGRRVEFARMAKWRETKAILKNVNKEVKEALLFKALYGWKIESMLNEERIKKLVREELA